LSELPDIRRVLSYLPVILEKILPSCRGTAKTKNIGERMYYYDEMIYQMENISRLFPARMVILKLRE
jgi:hypothetical protein